MSRCQCPTWSLKRWMPFKRIWRLRGLVVRVLKSLPQRYGSSHWQALYSCVSPPNTPRHAELHRQRNGIYNNTLVLWWETTPSELYCTHSKTNMQAKHKHAHKPANKTLYIICWLATWRPIQAIELAAEGHFCNVSTREYKNEQIYTVSACCWSLFLRLSRSTMSNCNNRVIV